MTFLLANWRILGLGVIVLLLGIQTWRLNSCQTTYQEYRVSVEAIARHQIAKNAAILESNEQLNQEVVDAKDRVIVDLSKRYDAARRRVRNNPSRGGLPTTPAPPSLATACESTDRLAGGLGSDQAPPVAEVATNVARLAAVEAALLDALERADREMVKYRQLWKWSQMVR